MSSADDDVLYEQETEVEEIEQNDDSTSEEAEGSADDAAKAAEEAKQARREKAYQDEVKSFLGKVASGELELVDAPYERLRKDAEERLKKLTPQSKGQVDADLIVERVKVETQLENDKEMLSEEEAKELQEAYDDFRTHGYTLSEARQKARKLLGILSPSEQARQKQLQGMRVIPAGRSGTSTQPTVEKKVEQKYMDNLPAHIKALQKN